MSFSLPPVVKVAEQLRREIELAVRRFARYHKYTTGTDLRVAAKKVVALTHRAWRDRARQREWLAELVWAVDEIKLELQLGREVKAFASGRQFVMLVRIAADLGKQVGGWNKQQHPKGQNRASVAAPERAQILSARAASNVEAQP
jgi:hypothetical protein